MCNSVLQSLVLIYYLVKCAYFNCLYLLYLIVYVYVALENCKITVQPMLSLYHPCDYSWLNKFTSVGLYDTVAYSIVNTCIESDAYAAKKVQNKLNE